LDPRIATTKKVPTNMQLPQALRDAIDAAIEEVEDLGEIASLADFVQASIFEFVQKDAAELGERIRAYRRARMSHIPTPRLKVVPIRRPGARRRGRS